MKTASEQAKKVLFLVTKSNYGGAQRYVYDLATHLPTGFEPMVAFGPAQGTDQPGLLARKLAAAGIRTVFLPELGRDIDVADIGAYQALRVLFAAEQPHVVHLNSSKAGLLGALAARAARVPRIIFTAHGWPYRENRNPLWRAVAWLGSVATVALSHTTICVSEADRRSLAWLFPTKLVRIYNGIDLAMVFGSGNAIRTAFPAGAHIVGTIGELTANKNQVSLVEAARANPAMYVAIVGEGEDRAALEALIETYALSNRVKLFGFLPAADVLKGFDTFALPSKKEGLPYVLLEARAAGLPIEARRTGGVGEALDMPLETFSLERMVQETIAVYQD